MKKVIFFLAALFLLGTPVRAGEGEVLAVAITGPITPVQVGILEKGLDKAREKKSLMLLLRLDTPGGTLSSARDMVKKLLNTSIPTAVWVGPSGARAASAGVFLVAACDYAAMAPKTTIGSATPVQASGKDAGKTMRKKVAHELTSLMRSLGREKKRNIEWYEKSVTQSANLNGREAVQKKVVEYIAPNERNFLQQLSSDKSRLGEKLQQFSGKNIKINSFRPAITHKILSWLVHPQVAYLLFLGGIMGFFFELSNPGAIFPGVFGAICLILALYAFSVLPTSVAGILLILTGFFFFLLELKVTSFGLLGLGASGSIFLGSLMLFDSPQSGLEVPLHIIIPAVLTIVIFFLGIIYLVGKSQLTARGKEFRMTGMTGKIVHWEGDRGKIKLRGEIWNCQGSAESGLQPGEEAQVTDSEGLLLYVEPVSAEKTASPKEF